ncbi:hypothetical protein [Micromonospora sp. NPDC049799]|uniref:hypothetical protein n=1 Tax=Micromonospora sp. NPDC049799 TaxID=3154741 RepID=UPI0033C4E754
MGAAKARQAGDILTVTVHLKLGPGGCEGTSIDSVLCIGYRLDVDCGAEIVEDPARM